MNFISSQEISLTVQLIHLKRLHPSGTGYIVSDQLVWLQRICPHSLAHEYLCRLEYRRHRFPCMFVIDPPITQLAGGRPPPHVRSMEEPIAMWLFLLEEDCWNPSMLVAEIVVPMANS